MIHPQLVSQDILLNLTVQGTLFIDIVHAHVMTNHKKHNEKTCVPYSFSYNYCKVNTTFSEGLVALLLAKATPGIFRGFLSFC